MPHELILRIVLQNPTTGVVYGIQKGQGHNYETVQKQTSNSSEMIFEIVVDVKINKEGKISLLGPYTQGTPQDRFVYLDIGKTAGQTDSIWSRRLKIPLSGITEKLLKRTEEKITFITTVAGQSKDGSPNCGTVKPFEGWKPA